MVCVYKHRHEVGVDSEFDGKIKVVFSSSWVTCANRFPLFLYNLTSRTAARGTNFDLRSRVSLEKSNPIVENNTTVLNHFPKSDLWDLIK